MNTVGEAIKELNDRHCHPNNFHIAMIEMDLLLEGTDEENNTSHDLMKQTYDWRYAGKIKGQELPKDDDVFHVDLTAANMRYIGRALEVYDKLCFDLHMKPILERMITKMGADNK